MNAFEDLLAEMAFQLKMKESRMDAVFKQLDREIAKLEKNTNKENEKFITKMLNCITKSIPRELATLEYDYGDEHIEFVLQKTTDYVNGLNNVVEDWRGIIKEFEEKYVDTLECESRAELYDKKVCYLLECRATNVTKPHDFDFANQIKDEYEKFYDERNKRIDDFFSVITDLATPENKKRGR